MRYDAGSRARTATPQELRTEITRLEAQIKQHDAGIQKCKNMRDHDPFYWDQERAKIGYKRDLDARRIDNLKYDLRCSRSLDDTSNDEWRPSAGSVLAERQILTAG
jgi:hypothetical protein